MSNLIAIQYDIEATIKFKDVTWVIPQDKTEPLLDDLAGVHVADATRQMLEEELAFLGKPEELGGFTVEVAISNPTDVTAELEAEIRAED